jgi:peptidyl-prolyl cis-trans isomerase SurA
MSAHSYSHSKNKFQNSIRIFSILLLALFSVKISAQKKKDIVLSIGNIGISKDEFIANYQKNNTNILDEKDKKTPAEYLDLYLNFKLKVLEAQRLGYDTVKSFVSELEGYRRDLAKPYLTDVSYNEEMVKTAYYRTQHERKASHILVMVNPDASPADTLTAWNKIADLRKQILAGADFNEIAAKYSEDPSAVQNKGMLGYFRAFQMVYPFEDATYKTPVEQVSEIIRTRFGYHLIKVHDERLFPGEIKVAHIMKIFPPQASEETIARLKLAEDSIWQKATSGADFAALAKQYSDDKQSASEGGVMNWFSASEMQQFPTFADAAFALKNDGDISPVIRTVYGWHIIKRLEFRTTPPFEKIRADLESKIKQNPAISKYSDEAFDHKLRMEYQLKIDEANWARFFAAVADSTKRNELKQKVLVTFANQTISVGQFADYIQKQNPSALQDKSEPELKTLLNQLIHEKLIAYENTRLEKKHPDFARIFQEYHDGILLFNISKDKIWDVASNDTLRLQKYFSQTEKKYFWKDRFKGLVIEAADLQTRSRVEKLLEEKEYTPKELEDVFNTKTENKVQFRTVAAEKGDDPIVDYFIWNGTKPSGLDETTTFVHGKIVSNEPKELKDAWGLYSSDLQEQIEKEWIDSLRKKYPIRINKKVLNTISSVE